MRIKRHSRFKKGREPYTYNSLSMEVSVEELQWLIRNHDKGKGHGICTDVGKTVFSLHIVPHETRKLPEF